MAKFPLGGTQSIVAVDRRAGEIGAAVLSQSFASGSKMIWSEPGVGVVVAQGSVEPSYGPLALALLKGGKNPQQTLKSLLATDLRPGVRQVMIMDSKGRKAAHTGKGTLPLAGHQSGRGFCVQASFVGARRGWASLAASFRRGRGPLAERLVSALEAGELATKGHRRGGAPRSASLVVVATKPSGTPWEGRVLDLRVDDSDNPVRELRRVLRVQDAYRHAESGGELVAKGDVERGQKEFAKAAAMAGDGSEFMLWLALGLLKRGDTKRGAAALRRVLGRGNDVKAVMRELAGSGLVGKPPVQKQDAKPSHV